MSGLPTPEYIRMLRKRLGITQKELARRAGVSQSLIARIERGTVDPRLSTIRRILSVLESAEPMGERVVNVMRGPVVTVEPDTPLEKIARTMWEKGISQVPVITRQGRVIGTVEEKDLVDAIIKYGSHALKLRAKEIMDDPLPIVSIGERLENVVNLLMSGTPAVLVVKEGRLVGIVTKSDIIAYQLRQVDNF